MLMANVKIPGKLLAHECELLQNSLLHSDILVRPHRDITSSVLFVSYVPVIKASITKVSKNLSHTTCDRNHFI